MRYLNSSKFLIFNKPRIWRKPSIWETRMPIVKNNCWITPVEPRNLLGETSYKYVGIKPQAIPMQFLKLWKWHD